MSKTELLRSQSDDVVGQVPVLGAADGAVALAGGHRLLLERTEQRSGIRLVAPDGSEPIIIDVTSGGVTIRVGTPKITLDATGDLNISAETLVLEGRKGTSIRSGRDLELLAESQVRTQGQSQEIVATGGSIAVKASDDVRLSGERVMVNCDETIDRYFRPSK